MSIEGPFVLLLGAMAAAAPAGPELGQPATAEEIAAWDIDVGIDGTGLPPGEGNVQAGQTLYETHCEVCHGPEGIGGSADELAGSDEPLASDWPDKTIGTYWPYATTLFDFIRRSKPMTRPGTLSDEEVYSLAAYLLYLNEIIPEDGKMNSETLPAVVMPNRDGFISCYPEPEPTEETRWRACKP